MRVSGGPHIAMSNTRLGLKVRAFYSQFLHFGGQGGWRHSKDLGGATTPPDTAPAFLEDGEDMGSFVLSNSTELKIAAIRRFIGLTG
jgi:hypothetical protein